MRTDIIVQKYGGSSVADPERIRNVARRVSATYQQRSRRVVVVVSAMGKTTDQLIELAHQITPNPDPRELDLLLSTGEIVSIALLAMALRDLGHEAISLTGYQAGIRTEARYGAARILDVDPVRIRRELDRGRIVIVAGFQGFTEEFDITTLGRGGSDTTAVALAAALEAAACEIYTDVDGIFTADPRIVPEARKLDDISYEEMLELASQGAKVMAARAVELGELFDQPILVASSFNDRPGTLIHRGVSMEKGNKVRGIAHDLNVGKVTIIGVPDRPGIAAQVFGPLAEAGISVDVIVQNTGHHGKTDLSYSVAKADLPKAAALTQEVAKAIGAEAVTTTSDLGKVSIVGSGMQSAPGYAARMFDALYRAGINIEMITTSEIRITCIIAADRVVDAVRALHAAFELETRDNP
ncbi:MAG: aspartate kinase [Chloroflexota bacterium]|nr:aspartate kinase [Dehalococcoidia bacterium]MDW8252272.1 aspartate kinase [Chloroflexota bacterium]